MNEQSRRPLELAGPPDATLVLTSDILRRVGTWTEGAWTMQGEPPQLVKMFGWQQAVTVAGGRGSLELNYWGRARVEPKAMEDLHSRARAERAALDRLEAMVTAATRGYAYVQKPELDKMLVGTLVAMMAQWAEGGHYPMNYPMVLAQVVRNTFAQYNAEVAGCEAFGAVIDPDHPDWGLRVAIEPVPMPTPLIETA